MVALQLMFQRNRGMVWMLKNVIAAIVVWFLVGIAGAASVFAGPLTYHNGPVLTNPSFYIIYWGSAWQTGFTTNNIPSSQYQTYLEGFINSICNTSWLLTQQMYSGAACNSNNVIGVWNDTENPPQTPSTSDIGSEVRKALFHFEGINYLINPIYGPVVVIAFPPGNGPAGFVAKGGSACAWHSMIDYRAYIAMPFQPDAPNGCGQFDVNSMPGDKFGHGVFDGVSIIMGHEVAETLTNPTVGGDKNYGGGWYDFIGGNSAETGDKCAWYRDNNYLSSDGNYYAVQPLFMNQFNYGKCVMGESASLGVTPASPLLSAETNHLDKVQITLSNTGKINVRLGGWYYYYITGSDAQEFYADTDCSYFNFQPQGILRPGGSCSFPLYYIPGSNGVHQANLNIDWFDEDYNYHQEVIPLTGVSFPSWMTIDKANVGGALRGDLCPQCVAPSFNVSFKNSSDTQSHQLTQVRLGGLNPSDFSILEDLCSGQDLGPSQECRVYLNFLPTATGERRAELEFTDETGEIHRTTVMGEGLGPVTQLSTTRLEFDEAFYNSDVGTPGGPTSAEIPVSGAVPQDVVLTNSGQWPLAINGVEVTGDFAPDYHDCPQFLEVGQSCTIQVRIMPTHFQFQSGSLMIYDNSSDSPHEVKLSGVVSAPLPSLSRDEMQFGSVPVGFTSIPQMVELENLEGDLVLHIQSIAVTGDFTATSDCPQDLVIGKCAITITMKPTAAGRRSGMLVVTDNAPNSPQQIPLIGTGCGRGDLDCDGDVDRNDLRILLSNINKPVSSCPGCDLNGDGKINVFDAIRLVTLCTRWACAVR